MQRRRSASGQGSNGAPRSLRCLFLALGSRSRHSSPWSLPRRAGGSWTRATVAGSLLFIPGCICYAVCAMHPGCCARGVPAHPISCPRPAWFGGQSMAESQWTTGQDIVVKNLMPRSRLPRPLILLAMSIHRPMEEKAQDRHVVCA